ncbi:MAG: GNAT family N-acetyltransferase [Candidatus Eremiobacteraeota bacterium]|nr:GNAT family N-acetyltransferase [Candidatus Eremiobacteraeota bacterium]
MLPEPFVFDVDGKPVLVPFVRMSGSRLKWKIYCGFPLGGYDVIFDMDGTVLRDDKLRSALAALAALKIDDIEFTLWPMVNLTPSPPWVSQEHETSIIDLAGGVDAAIENMDGRTRRMAGQAQRRGVVVHETNDAASVASYYDLLLLSAKRWGRAAPTVSRTFVEALANFGGHDVELWLAHYEGKAIAGLMLLYGSEEVNVWSAAMDADYAVLRPHNILHVAAMRAAAARGVRWYNLGSSEGLPGVKKFKEGLGAQTVHYNRLRLEKGLYRSYRALRRTLSPRRQPE